MSFIDKSKKQEFLKTIITDVDKSPVALQGVTTIFRYVRDVLKIMNVTYRDINDYVKRYVRSNQIIRNRIINHPRLSYKSYGLNHQWQGDIVDLHAKGSQKGNRHVLTVIDLFSRQADAEIIASKSAFHVLSAFKKIVERNGRPHIFQTDEGKEFKNKHFQKYCKEKKIHFLVVNSEMKAAVVERFNRTFQNRYYKFLMNHPKKLKSDIVATVIRNYNNTPHSVTGFIPSQIDEDNSGEILKEQLDLRDRMRELRKMYVKHFRFQEGDYVRLSSPKMVFSKEYRGTFTEEIFKVVEKSRRPPHWNINLYKIEDLLGEEIEGVFYEEQLEKVYLPKDPREGKVIRRDKKLGKLVRLVDYPKGHFIWKK